MFPLKCLDFIVPLCVLYSSLCMTYRWSDIHVFGVKALSLLSRSIIVPPSCLNTGQASEHSRYIFWRLNLCHQCGNFRAVTLEVQATFILEKKTWRAQNVFVQQMSLLGVSQYLSDTLRSSFFTNLKTLEPLPVESECDFWAKVCLTYT